MGRDGRRRLPGARGAAEDAGRPGEIHGVRRMLSWEGLLEYLGLLKHRYSFGTRRTRMRSASWATSSTARYVVIHVFRAMCHMAPSYIKWPSICEKQISAGVFARSTGIANIIGAIDGRHIRLQGPMRHASDYINRKGYYSVLLTRTL